MVSWKLHEPSQIFIDGYHKVPKPFVQLVTIMAYFPNIKKSLPIISCLMNKKTKDAYRRLFARADALMREEFNQDQKMLNPQVVTTDFELALLNAAEEYWPNAKRQGCFVHFLRAQINQLKKLGFSLKELRRKNYQLITLISALAFVRDTQVFVLHFPSLPFFCFKFCYLLYLDNSNFQCN